MMGKHSIDRRVRRTHGALQQAFLNLLSHKAYDEITIADICESANVGRSTFYAHYRGKDDLKRSGIDEHLRGELEERRAADVTAGGAPASPTLVIFEHARDHLPHYRSLVRGRGAQVALEAIGKSLAAMLKAEQWIRETSPATVREMKVQYLVGAFLAVLTWWLDRGAPEAPDEIERLFVEMSSGTD